MNGLGRSIHSRPLGDDHEGPQRLARGQAVRVCVLRPTLAGEHRDSPRITSSTPALACHRQGDREWCLRPHTRTTCPSSTEDFGTAGHQRCRQGGGGACGHRPHSRSPWRRHGTPGVDAATVAARGGRPRARAGERRYRRRPATMPVTRRADQRRPHRADQRRPIDGIQHDSAEPRLTFRGSGRRSAASASPRCRRPTGPARRRTGLPGTPPSRRCPAA